MTEAFETLTEEVRGLRSDLIEYRETVAEVLSRRIRVLAAVGIVALLSFLTITVGAFALLRVEEDRTASALREARAESCIMARNVQSQTLAIIRALPEDADDGFVRDAVAALASDPCNLDDTEDTR